MRGTAQNPDIYFQDREACQQLLRRRARHRRRVHGRRSSKLTGREYKLFDYDGAPDAERRDHRHGLRLRSHRRDHRLPQRTRRESRPAQGPPLPPLLRRALPGRAARDRARSIAVLDRTKEPGALGEPLYLDVCTALRENGRDDIAVVGGRYGLGSKEFTPTMVKAVYRQPGRRSAEEPLHRRHRRRRDQPLAARWASSINAAPEGTDLLQVLRPRLRRHRRRQQELHQDHRRPHRPVRAGLLRLRLQEVRRHHRLPPALRQEARSSPPT